MPKFRIELSEQLPFPPDRVFPMLADHHQLGELVRVPVKRIRDSDQADPNGIGSVRWVGFGPVGFEETIVTFEPDYLIESTVTSFSGLRNHLGRVRLSGNPETGTRLHLMVEFDTMIPYSGKTVERILTRVLSRGIRRLRHSLATN